MKPTGFGALQVGDGYKFVFPKLPGSRAYIPVCSYLCLNNELLFWNILSHKSQAYIPFSVFRIFFLGGVESESF